jgi:hypothetical protein
VAVVVAVVVVRVVARAVARAVRVMGGGGSGAGFLVVQAVDKYPLSKIGSHKKYIHMKCGCCKTQFIGCEVIGKSILKSNQ